MEFGILKYFKHKRLQQAGSLYTAMIVSMIGAFVASVINTRTLGPDGYGDFKFINNLYLFMSELSLFGIAFTTSQLVAKISSAENKKHELIGGSFVITASFSILFILFCIIFSFFEPKIFGNNLQTAIIIFSPLVAIYIFDITIESVLQGDNQIHYLSLFRILPQILFVSMLLLFNALSPLNVNTTLTIQMVVGLGVTYFFYKKVRPSYDKYIQNIKVLWEANRSYGWHVYVGSLSNVATAYLSTFLISYFLDNKHVGFFSLAVNLTMPLMQLASVVGTTYFKDFAHIDKLPFKVTFLTISTTFIAVLLFILIIKPLVVLVYSEKFLSVASIAGIIAVGSAMQGLGDYFNRFLGAHGRGKELRNGAIIVGVINIIGYYILIKFFGILGAAITRLVAGLVYCGMMFIYYVKFRKILATTLSE